MNSELAKDRTDDVGVEYVGLRPFFGETFDRLGNVLADHFFKEV